MGILAASDGNKVQVSRVEGSRVSDLGSRIQVLGLALRAWGLEFRLEGLGIFTMSDEWKGCEVWRGGACDDLDLGRAENTS